MRQLPRLLALVVLGAQTALAAPIRPLADDDPSSALAASSDPATEEDADDVDANAEDSVPAATGSESAGSGKALRRGAISEIQAKVPLKTMFGYSTELRSATQGRAVFTMQFSEYDHR